MKTTRLLLAIAFAMIALISNAQLGTCTNPKVIAANDTCTPQDTFTVSQYYLRFQASVQNYAVKVYIQNLTGYSSVSVRMYKNDCSNLLANLVHSSIGPTINGDTISVNPDTLTIGADYLIEINAVSGMKFQNVVYSVCLKAYPLQPTAIGNCNPTFTTACNLVCNGGFEGTNPSPFFGLANIGAAFGWGSAYTGASSSSPDLFNVSPFGGNPGGVPCNAWGNQNANTGNNYAGIITAACSTATTPLGTYMEYIETQLTSTLTPNSFYEISMYVSRGDFAKFNNTNLAVYLTNTLIASNTTTALVNSPSGITTNAALLNDTAGWQKVTFCYKANGGEKFLTIGASTFIPIGQGGGTNTSWGCTAANWLGLGWTTTYSLSYIYIDDVSMTQIVPTINSTVNPSCSSNPVIFSITSCTLPANAVYDWAFGDGATLNNGGLNTNHVYAPGTYTVTVTITLPCGVLTATTTVTVPNILPPPVSITVNPNPICQGQSSTLSQTGLVSYTWQPGGVSNSPITVSPAVTTVYTVSGTDAGGCIGTKTATLVVNPLPIITIAASSGSICSGLSATLTASGANTYTWQPGNLTGSSVLVSPTSTTVYTCTGTTAAGCTNLQTQQITVTPSPTLTITKSPNTNICPGTSVTLTYNGASSYTTNPGGFTTNPVVVSPTATTVYTVTGANGSCVATATASIFVNNINIFPVANPSVICQGQSTTLSSSPNVPTYTWQPINVVGNNIVVTPTASTVYTVSIKYSAQNCIKTGTVGVTVNPLPSLLVFGTSTLCSGTTGTLVAFGASTYTWSPGALTGSLVTINPNSTTGFTVVGTGANGCKNSFSGTVTVIPTPTITGLSSVPICPGNSATLTPGGAPSFTTNPGGLTGTPVVVTPTATTIYTVTGENTGCTSTRTAVVVVRTTTVNAIATPSVICVGNSSTLTATGINTLTWQPTGQTGSPIVVTPTATSVYTVSGVYSPQNCPASQTVMVVVQTPTNSIAVNSSGGNYICAGQTTTLTTNIINPAGYNFFWNPGGYTTPTVVLSPTDNYQYTCTVSSAGGCGGGTAVFCVDVTSTLCCAVSNATLTNYTINGGPYNNLNNQIIDVYGTLTINTNVSWLNCYFRMHTGSKIVVNAPFLLDCQQTYLFSCEDMWNGIEVLQDLSGGPGARIQFWGSHCEDAYKGIHFDGLTGNYAKNVWIDHSYFNKDYIGVELENISTISSGQLYFTSDSYYQSQPSTTSPGANIKCSNYYTPTVIPRGIRGINFKYVQKGLFLGPLPTKSPLGPIYNYFDNLDNGVYLTESGLNVWNATFTHFKGNNRFAGYYANVGAAVYAIANATVASPPSQNYLDVDDCYFSDTWRGVSSYGMTSVKVRQSVFTTGTTSSPACVVGCLGNTAVMINDARTETRVDSNQVTSYDAGILSYYSNLTATSPFVFGIGNNTVTVTGGGRCQIGIQLQDAANNFGSGSYYLPIAANRVVKVWNGIHAVNINGGLRISNNNVALVYNPAFTFQQNGIFLQSCTNAIVDWNFVHSSNTTSPLLRGIHMQVCPTAQVGCNTISTIGQCLIYDGLNFSSINGFYNNNFGNALDGLVIENNGYVGQQGNSSFAAHNRWVGTYNNSRTLTDLFGGATSSATNTPLYVYNTNLDNPVLGATVSSGPNLTMNGLIGRDDYHSTTTPFPASIFTVSASASTFVCPTALTSAFVTTIAPQPVPSSQRQAVTDSGYIYLTNAAINYTVLNTETHIIHNKHTYRSIRKGYTPTDTSLVTFYTTKKAGSYEQYEQVDSLIAYNQTSSAIALNSSAAISNNIEQNQNTVNGLLAKQVSNNFTSFTLSEITQLKNIARQCPLSGGTGVYQARALLSILTHKYIYFPDSCGSGGAVPDSSAYTDTTGIGSRYADIAGIESPTEKKNTSVFLLYPNPNNGNINILYTLNETEDVYVHVNSATGQNVLTLKLEKDQTKVEIDLHELREGIYFYRIESGGRSLKTDKIVIIK